MKPGEDPGMEETPAGSGKQNKSTRGGNSLLVTEGAEGLNEAFPREHHPRETVTEMVPYFPDGNGSLFPICGLGSGVDIPRKTKGAECTAGGLSCCRDGGKLNERCLGLAHPHGVSRSHF